jgi:hypothetical protein
MQGMLAGRALQYVVLTHLLLTSPTTIEPRLDSAHESANWVSSRQDLGNASVLAVYRFP